MELLLYLLLGGVPHCAMVPDEHARGAAVARVPHAHGAVVRAGGQQVAVGVPPHHGRVAVVPCARPALAADLLQGCPASCPWTQLQQIPSERACHHTCGAGRSLSGCASDAQVHSPRRRYEQTLNPKAQGAHGRTCQQAQRPRALGGPHACGAVGRRACKVVPRGAGRDVPHREVVAPDAGRLQLHVYA